MPVFFYQIGYMLASHSSITNAVSQYFLNIYMNIVEVRFDGNSELVAELVTANGYKAAFAVKDGAEGSRGWKVFDALGGLCLLPYNNFIHSTKFHHLLVPHCRAVTFPGRLRQKDSALTWANYLG